MQSKVVHTCPNYDCGKRFDRLESNTSILKQDVSTLKQDVAILKQDVAILKQDVAELKESFHQMGILMEDTNHKLDLVLENLVSSIDLRDRVVVLESSSKKHNNEIELLKLAITKRS